MSSFGNRSWNGRFAAIVAQLRAGILAADGEERAQMFPAEDTRPSVRRLPGHLVRFSDAACSPNSAKSSWPHSSICGAPGMAQSGTAGVSMKARSPWIYLLLFGGCGPTMAQREAQLAEYRRLLEQVHAHQQPMTLPLGEPKLLVGLSREKIWKALGEPFLCKTFNGKEAPCRSKDDLDYTFYELYDRDEPDVRLLGGGPELHLRFDAAGICRSAWWAFTK